MPNFSGVFDNRFERPYDIHAAMSAPAPGSAPTSVPRMLPRNVANGYVRSSVPWPLKTRPISCCTGGEHAVRADTANRMTSDTANMPIITGIS